MSGRLGFKSWLWHLPQLYDYVLYLCLVTQSCPPLYNPMDYSRPGASVHGILQARILEWVAMPSSRGSSQASDRTQVSHIAGGFLTSWATREARETHTQPQEEKFTWKISGSILCNHPHLRALLGWEQKGSEKIICFLPLLFEVHMT